MAGAEEKQQRITEIDKGSMDRTLGLGDLFAVGYGDLGSSIYYALGITTLFSLGAAPISLALAGLVFACTALSYAELSSMLQRTGGGGSAAFTRHVFNDLISFIAGWGLLLDFIVTIAISSYSIGSYLSFFVPLLKIPGYKIILTICLISSLFVLNFFGAKSSTRVSWFLTTLTLITQLLIIIAGIFYFIHIPDLLQNMRINIKGSLWSPSWPDFWRGTTMAMVAYTGIESMAQLSSEAKSPSRTVPRAMMLAMGMLLFVYIGTAVVALSAMTPQELSTQYLEDPIAGIVAKLPFAGRLLGGWVGLLAAIILFVAANAGLMGASRLSFRMGENYQVPRFVYRLHKRYRTPFVSLAVFAILAIAIVVVSRGRITFLADLYNFGAMLAFFMTHLSLIFLRIKKPDMERPFRAPLNLKLGRISFPITALIGGIATLSTWFLVIIEKPDGRYLGFTWVAIGLAMYFYYRRKQRIAPTGRVDIQKIKIPEFKSVRYHKILVPTRGGQETETVQVACQIAKFHSAELMAINVIEIPFSLPLDAPLYHRTVIAESVLNRAEAIGRELHLPIKMKMISARSVSGAVLKLAQEDGFDLIVLGAAMPHRTTPKNYSATVERVLRHAPCPVWICYHLANSKKLS
ncbi:MAG: universal stress protein [Chlamydiota bacterium]